MEYYTSELPGSFGVNPYSGMPMTAPMTAPMLPPQRPPTTYFDPKPMFQSGPTPHPSSSSAHNATVQQPARVSHEPMQRRTQSHVAPRKPSGLTDKHHTQRRPTLPALATPGNPFGVYHPGQPGNFNQYAQPAPVLPHPARVLPPPSPIKSDATFQRAWQQVMGRLDAMKTLIEKRTDTDRLKMWMRQMLIEELRKFGEESREWERAQAESTQLHPGSDGARDQPALNKGSSAAPVQDLESVPKLEETQKRAIGAVGVSDLAPQERKTPLSNRGKRRKVNQPPASRVTRSQAAERQRAHRPGYRRA